MYNSEGHHRPRIPAGNGNNIHSALLKLQYTAQSSDFSKFKQEDIFKMATRFVILMVATFILLVSRSKTEECPQDSAPSLRRVYIALYEGPGNFIANEMSFAQTIGNCSNPIDLATKMFEHFSTFDIDLTPVRENPFEPYECDSFVVLPRISHPDASFRIVLKSDNGYADVVNSPFKFAAWMLLSNGNLTGQSGLLQAGYISIIGMIRFNDNGQDVCLPFSETAPLGPLGKATFVWDLIAEHDKWGTASIKGLTRINEGSEVLNAHFIITF